MLTKVTKDRNIGVRFPVNFCLRTGKDYNEHANNFKGYEVVQCRSKVSVFRQITGTKLTVILKINYELILRYLL